MQPLDHRLVARPQTQDVTVVGGLDRVRPVLPAIGAVQLVELFLGIQSSQNWESGDPERLTHSGDRHSHQSLGIRQPGNRGRLKIGTEPANDPVVGRSQRQSQHDRNCHLKEEAEAGMAQIQIRMEARPHAGGTVDLQEQIA